MKNIVGDITFRKVQFDYLRIISIILVVACHSISVAYPYLNFNEPTTQKFELLSWYDQIFSSFVAVIGRLGVPFFFMLTGYFLIDRLNLTEDSIIKFYKKRFWRLFITFELWMILYEIFVRVFMGVKVTVIQIIFELLFINKQPSFPMGLGSFMWQIWFIPVILGIYMSMPLLTGFIKIIPQKIQIGFVTVAIIIDFIFPTINLLLQVISKNSTMNTAIDHGFLGTAFGIYVLLGAEIKKGWLNKLSSSVLCGIVSISSGLALFMQLELNLVMTHAYFIWYDNVFLLITAAAIFELVNRKEHKPDNGSNWIKTFSDLSLGVYLIHRPVQIILGKVLISTQIGIVNFLINILVTYVVSLLFVYFLSRMKILKKYLFYGK